jgi:hypothetical protein
MAEASDALLQGVALVVFRGISGSNDGLKVIVIDKVKVIVILIVTAAAVIIVGAALGGIIIERVSRLFLDRRFDQLILLGSCGGVCMVLLRRSRSIVPPRGGQTGRHLHALIPVNILLGDGGNDGKVLNESSLGIL